MYDLSGSGYNGVLQNATSGEEWVNGKYGNAINFDGVDDKVSIWDSSTCLFTPEDWTLAAWFNTHGQSGNNATIIGIGDIGGGDKAGMHLRVHPTGAVRVGAIVGADSSEGESTIENTYTDGNWYHAVGTKKGTDLRLYIDGVLNVTDVLTSAVMDYSDSINCDGDIGHLTGYANPTFHGSLDEVRIYNRALSAGEVSRLYRMTRPKINVTRTTGTLSDGLVGHWTFDGKDTYGTHIKDVSGKNNHGTDSGGSTPTIGKVGQGRRFDGVDDRVDTRVAASNFVTASAGTIAVWMKPTQIHTASSCTAFNLCDGVIVDSNGVSTGGNIGIVHGYLGVLGDAIWVANRDSGGFDYIEIPYTVDEWIHIVWVHGNGTVYGYKNGDLIDAIPSGDTTTLTHPVVIGRSFNGKDFQGTLDDVRIYNRSLTADEIKRLYNLGR